jgi:REP element-mobilizing transposase RayT
MLRPLGTMAISPSDFIKKWSKVSLSERSSYQQHFLDLCELAGHPKPAEADPTGDSFCFERGAEKHGGGDGWADVWKRGLFAFEYKGRHANLAKAYDQLLRYRASLENPPLLVVCDTDLIEIHTNFTGTAEAVHRFTTAEFDRPRNLEILRDLFHNPEKLRPGRTSEAITKEAASALAGLAGSLRARHHDPEAAARFLDRIVFCLFAEDVGLLPDGVFATLLENTKGDPERFARYTTELFRAMAAGGEFQYKTIPHFNGGLFSDPVVLDLDAAEIAAIHEASKLDWGAVDPSIFGTLFQRGLDPSTRAALGAEYTGRQDIEDLIEPVLIAPLRREWESIRTAITNLLQTGKKNPKPGLKPPTGPALRKALAEAASLKHAFLVRLARIHVLDPACGSGNFLYIGLQKLKDLEKEAILFGADEGVETAFFPSIGPWQFHGLEINPYAFELAQMTLWIGYLQWHRGNGYPITETPLLKKLDNFHLMDALLDRSDPASPKEAAWPEFRADHEVVVVGNPPFLGGKIMRRELGDDYVTALLACYGGRVPAEADLCCYWFEKARALIETGKIRRAGLLATQGIRGGANREVLKRIKESGEIFFAVSDRDWILDGANVHISMVGFCAKDGSVGVPPASQRSVGILPALDKEAGKTPTLPSGDRTSFFNPLAEIDISTHKLPHWNQEDCYCFVTWRLEDAMPKEKLDEWKQERDAWIEHHPKPWTDETSREYHSQFSHRLDEWLDAGHGSCVLKNPPVRKIVADALEHFDGQRYELASYVIMPNHVHVILRLKPGYALADILHSWKSFTAKAVDKLLGRTGPLWQPEYWDRLIRGEPHLHACLTYIWDNPGKARLAKDSFTYWQRSIKRSVGVPPAFEQKAGKMPALLCVLDGKPVVEISPSLTAGSDAREAAPFAPSLGISFMGITPAGPFDLPFDQVRDWLAEPNPHGRPNSDVLRPYLNGKDINQRSRGQWTVDFTGLGQENAALYEKPFAHLDAHVRPERTTNNRENYRNKWWLYAEAREGMRKALAGHSRYLATCMVAKHRLFSWLSIETLPANVVIVFARSDDFFFGVLHSRIHEAWSLAQGTQLREKESGFRYTPTTCFETFPFPWDHRLPVAELSPEQQACHARISEAARALDDLRTRWLNPPEWTREEILEFSATPGGPWDRFIKCEMARYPRQVPRDADCAKRLADRTLTKLYNARPAWLASAHAELDDAVAAAYGWPDGLAPDDIIARLLARSC